jgi:type II secretory pathway component PulM
METPPTHDEDPGEKRHIFGMHIGDLGVILIAFLCTVTLFLILFQESPFQKLEIAQARQAKEAKQAAIDKVIADKKAVAKARQDAIDKAVASGEVNMSIAPTKH